MYHRGICKSEIDKRKLQNHLRIAAVSNINRAASAPLPARTGPLTKETIMKLKSYNTYRAVQIYGYRETPAEHLIMLRSPVHTHTELQFGPRYDNISFSATMQDDAKCCRFKMIEYTHPERWDEIDIPATDEQEDRVYREAKKIEGQPYDLKGLLSFGTELDIVKPKKNAWWCSECVIHILKSVFSDLPLEPDHTHPTLADTVCRMYFTSKPRATRQRIVTTAAESKPNATKGITSRHKRKIRV